MLLFHALMMDRQCPAHQRLLVGSGGLTAAMNGCAIPTDVIERLGLFEFNVFARAGGRGDGCHQFGNLTPHREFTLQAMAVVTPIVGQCLERFYVQRRGLLFIVPAATIKRRCRACEQNRCEKNKGFQWCCLTSDR